VSNNSTSFDYIRNHHEIPQLPDNNSRFKWIKKFITRSLAHFTSAQNIFNNNIVNVITELNNRQNDLIKSIENLHIEQQAIIKKQDNIQKTATSQFNNLDDRQNDLVKSIENLHKEQQAVTTRQNDLVKSIENLHKEQQGVTTRQDNIQEIITSKINDIDNRQNDIVSSLENTNKEQLIIATSQDNIRKIVISQFKDIDSRQNDLVKSIENIDNKQKDFVKTLSNIQKVSTSQFKDVDSRQSDLVKSIENLNEEQQNVIKRQAGLQKLATSQFKDIDNRQSDLVESVKKLDEEQQTVIKRQIDIQKHTSKQFKDIDNRQDTLVESLNQMNNKIAELFKYSGKAEQSFNNLHSLYNKIAEQNKAIKNIISTATGSSGKNSVLGTNAELKNFINDSLYSDYEQSFRGSEKIIKKRLTYYIDKLKNVKSSKENFILDVGCGRGEFVELLIENNFHAKGIDANSVAVQCAVSNNLPVKKGDLFNVLKKCKNNSLPVISAFHVIEHLNYGDMIKFFNMAVNKLKPKGKLLLETPNMLNLFVAAADFYKDPTHIRPLHPATLQFYLKEAGFSNVQVDFLHPFPKPEQLKILKNSTTANNNFIKLNNLIFGARDTSIIAIK